MVDRNELMFADRLCGESAKSIAERYRVSLSRVLQITQREQTKHLNDLEMQLLIAKREGNALALTVPFANQKRDLALALKYFAWVIEQLRYRGVQTKFIPSMTAEGLVLYLADNTDYSNRGEDL